MLRLFRILALVPELALGLSAQLTRAITDWVIFNPRLGAFRYVIFAAFAYVAFAVLLVYVVAPVRGFVGHYFLADKLRYDAERWLATAIYDRNGNFAGTFDARLDSLRDVNYTDRAIDVGDYTANPDHKSIPVRETPPLYWQCLVYQEDRYLGSWLNPFGIDLLGVLKIPYSTVVRSLALRRPSLGVGGSTLPMQFVRVIYNTPPHSNEGGLTKLRRKLSEWWLAPVVYRELTRGDDTPMKQWAANHLWLAQRTGGAPLHGVELASRVIFGKDAGELSVAEQFVLASAVNKPIILLKGSDRLNEVRLDRWRYITEVRARICAEKLLTDEAEKKKVVFELIAMAGGPPDPKVKPKLQAALERYAPDVAKRAEANPVVRANALMPSARFGLREEMKQAYGFAWREHVRGVTATFEAAGNLAFGEKVKAELKALDQALKPKITSGYTLDTALVSAETKMPNIVVVAANARGRNRPLLRGGRNGALLRLPVRARCRHRALQSRARPAHDRLHRQDHLRHRHRQLRPRQRRLALRRYTGARARPRNLRQGQWPLRPPRHRQLRLLAQRAAAQSHRACGPITRQGADRRLRLQHAEARCGGAWHAAVDGRRAGADLGQPSPRASHVGGRSRGHDRPGLNAGTRAFAGRQV